jgi:hypothetical protein
MVKALLVIEIHSVITHVFVGDTYLTLHRAFSERHECYATNSRYLEIFNDRVQPRVIALL